MKLADGLLLKMLMKTFTAEGLQGTIKYISDNIDYWLELKLAYINSKIIEIHTST